MNKKTIKLIVFLMTFILFFSNISYAQPINNEIAQEDIEASLISINLKDSIKRSRLNNESEELEPRFNLNEELSNKIIVRDQKRTGTCWAISYATVLETTLARKYNIKNIQYSPMHVEYKTTQIFNRGLNDGGEMDVAIPYSASVYGPVYESEFPFEDVYIEQGTVHYKPISEVDLNKPVKERVTDAVKFASIYKTYQTNNVIYKNAAGDTYTENDVQKIRNLVKKHIKENGAVSALFYISDMGASTSIENYTSSSYNPTTKAYYSTSMTGINHSITIVGWDDEFKKENFVEGNRPIHDGAYIALNSWGDKFGDEGYFYVSYDDVSIEYDIVGVSSMEQLNEDSFDNIYEYDPLGTNVTLPITNEERSAYLESGYAANVFTRKNPNLTNEYLTEVGIFLATTEGIEIYVNGESDDLTKAKLVATATGANALEAGYHVIKLSSPVLLMDEKFAVEVKYINSEKNIMPLECNTNDSGFGVDENDFYATAKANSGESFISKDGTTWEDINGYTFGNVTFKNTNACIKAFSTIPENFVTGMSLNKETVELTEGDTLQLIANVQPTNAFNKKVIWKSSNTKVATVNSDGKINALSEGNAIITAVTEEGGYTATCEVTVKKQEQTDIDIEPLDPTITVTGVTLNKEKLEMLVGENTSLVATVKPTNASNKNIQWASSNKNVATVSNNGKVTAVAEGKTTITVMTEDGKHSTSCEVIVSKAKETDTDETVIPVTGVTLNLKNLEIQEGEALNLVATISPSNASNKSVKWSSSNPKVATISNTGIIKTISAGETTITVETVDGKYKATCKLVVTSKTSSDDDIYKEGEEGDSNKDLTPISVKTPENTETDNTTFVGELPQTGIKNILVICIIATGVIALISYAMYKKMFNNSKY